MTDRTEIESLLHRLYEARARGDLDGVCDTFASDASFELAGASNGAPLTMKAVGADKYRPLLAIMIRSFKLRSYEIVALLVDGDRAAVQWRADIHSRITGTTVPTELVDVIAVAQRRIVSYMEFFVPR